MRLADDAAGLEVGEDAVEQLGIAQQRERGFALVAAHRDRLDRFGLQHLADLLVLQLLELEQYAAQIGLERVVGELQLDCSLGDVARPLLGRVQIERIDVEDLAAWQPER